MYSFLLLVPQNPTSRCCLMGPGAAPASRLSTVCGECSVCTEYCMPTIQREREVAWCVLRVELCGVVWCLGVGSGSGSGASNRGYTATPKM